MSFCSEEEDTVNQDIAQTLREMRESLKDKKYTTRPDTFSIGFYERENVRPEQYEDIRTNPTVW